jgi:hypothetical protein
MYGGMSGDATDLLVCYCHPSYVPTLRVDVQTFTNTKLLDDGLAEMRFDDPSLLQRHSLGRSSSRQQLAHNEDPGSSDGSQLLGKGQRLPAADVAGRAALVHAVQRFLKHNPALAAGWTKKLVAAVLQQQRSGTGAGVFTYKRALKEGIEQFSTDSYRKAQRQNYHVQVTFESSTGGDQKRVAVVKQLLWLRHPSNPAWSGCQVGEPLQPRVQQQLDRDLRLAVLDVLSVPTSSGDMLKVADMTVVQDPMRVVALSQVDGKFVVCQPRNSNQAYFVWYANMSKLL